ncbi:hypothetical protein RchiOBHm_Chr2g0111491 [Rosa chinensis]|uniref:Uncharacterized protein n=1 Tax=Rosa chinensis TaxID=74649 RepID=A0A2P6RPZ1_ROSCH|nr:hypothetical protein RchiOBHm_Chr2g0111491 [Rosa chinensis]
MIVLEAEAPLAIAETLTDNVCRRRICATQGVGLALFRSLPSTFSLLLGGRIVAYLRCYCYYCYCHHENDEDDEELLISLSLCLSLLVIGLCNCSHRSSYVIHI